MQITRSSIATRTGPRDWFTGGVYVDTITAQPRRRGCRPQAFSSRRAPGPPWHTHPVGQTIYVLELVGRCQRRGGPVEVIGPGDRVFFEPGEDHWHGAAPDRFMTHLAMLEVDEHGNSANWPADGRDLVRLRAASVASRAWSLA
jgi:quercetin dioxygenase-like cupin family protein